jgi:hypothetical protein
MNKRPAASASPYLLLASAIVALAAGAVAVIIAILELSHVLS